MPQMEESNPVPATQAKNSEMPQLSDYFPGHRPNGLQWPQSQILVAENHRLLFCPIAKNACSSLKRLFVSISDIKHKERILAEDVHRSIDFFRTGIKLLDLDLDRATQLMASAEYFKFAVVRDPFSRLLSAYLEKFVINRLKPGNQHHTGPVVAAAQNTASPDFQRGITFADFVRFVTAQEPEHLDPHWIPQTSYLRGVIYDRIYRMDQLPVLQRDLENRIGGKVALEHMNRSHSDRPRYVSGAARMLPDALPAPKTIDRHSFMESEILYRIADYFASDYRLYYSDSSPDTEVSGAPVTNKQAGTGMSASLLRSMCQRVARRFWR
ncbi:MAG: hypothetical protein H6R26_592 [Proteobacteria bacterium]|nr:hypothetical protein [Pseudomonadota bacterium]